MKDMAIKGGVASVLSIAAYMSKSFTPLIIILVLLEIFDYITGMISAMHHGGLSSKEALKGAIKKVSYFFLVGLAFCIDYTIYQIGAEFNIHYDWKSIFGILSVCYLISTEGISTLENLQEIGVSIPFLTKILEAVRQKIEKEAENKTKMFTERDEN